MLDIGWGELLLIGVVALIVIGPEDLPKLFRTLGRITARARSMAREFTSAIDDAAKSSGLDEAATSLKDVNKLASKKGLGLDALDRAAERFEKWDPMNPRSNGGAKTMPIPDPAAAPPTTAAPAPSAPAAPPTAQKSRDEITPPVTEASTGRRLHAVRRSDPNRLTGPDRKGD